MEAKVWADPNVKLLSQINVNLNIQKFRNIKTRFKELL